ncbi:pyridoxal phosphate-dependent aminotransferase [Phaeodactylibacter sp.]|jgi:aspartate aminotransferase|uniref:pyridoxal phosphate-dependent aminotransferase n=1 Tax=Phaeodactylibacter sp. TaxID=1940289 RepID=UPI0025E8A7E6|nr:pyridoxal phosphate-dependent aminotransferase [Phaeodactylibacter sp.]MCI4648510.1 pyridoxal phosphate-dependent aminotransferase [Phaeodactylibacter sp.]MCI5090681.1 pyridoxal phosphate-dependent aminotransferase [Phaeodactylibacter sp.]
MALAAKTHLAQRILEMEESATIKMAQMARDLAAEGHEVISLSLGEPDFDTPDHIKEAAKKALDDGYTKYTPVPGLVELRKAIQTKFKRDNGLEFDLSQIVVSNGAKQSIANICMSLLDEGDEVAILAPYWVSYSEIVKVAGGVPVLVSAGIEQDYKVTADQVREALTERTRILLFSSPCNPTGSVYTKPELQAIADVIAERDDIYIVSDEIYEYINFTDEHVSIGSFENVKDRTVTVNGFSKGFAMTGWRLGYIGAPQWIASACAKIQGQFTSGATAFGQMAGAHALTSDMTPTQEMKAAFLKRRDMMIEELSKISGMKVNKPQGAFYIFPDISAYFGKKAGDFAINTADDFCEYLLKEAHVAVVTGSAFGAPECFRISYAASEAELREAVKRIAAAVERLG